MKTAQALTLARRHVANNLDYLSSARLCLADAESLMLLGKSASALRRARDSLAYSVGVFHPDFAAVAAAFIHSTSN